MTDAFRAGAIFRYPYLWFWQDAKGETAGRKERPVCVIMPVKHGGLTHLLLLPISSQPPADVNRLAVEITPLEARRAGLDHSKRAWISLDDLNYDIVEKSHCFDPSKGPTGFYSEAFTQDVGRRLKVLLREKRARIVDRTK